MAVIELPQVLDRPSLPPLLGAMRAQVAAGEALLVDGAAVERVSLAGLQMLLSAAATARAQNLDFTLADASRALRATAALGGAGTALGIDTRETIDDE